MRSLLAASFIIFFAASSSFAQPLHVPAKLDGAQIAADVRLMLDALESIHPGLDRYDTKVDRAKALDGLRRLERTGGTELELYLAASRYLAAIRCDHTKAELSPQLSKYREDNPSHLPFRFAVIEGRMFVREFDREQATIERGTEVVKINGKKASELIDEFSEYVSVDGYTDHVRPFKLAEDSDLLGSDLDHFYPLRYGFGPPVALELKRPGGKAEKLNASLITYRKWRNLATEKRINNFSDPSAVEFRIADEVAYLRVATFINYRTPMDPYKVFSPIFEQIRERRVQHLIVDLRENGGGSDDVGVALGRFILPEPVAFRSRSAIKTLSVPERLRPYLETWDRSVFDVAPAGWSKNSDLLFEEAASPIELQPLPNAFDGRVTFLTSAYNASGVVVLMSRLKDLRPIRLVGEETGGSSEGPTAGIILFLKLPNSKIRVRIPVYRSYTGTKSFAPGKGLIPDIRITTTLDDLVSRRDRALEIALKN
ncbi:MAG TPA: hypothetical protein DEP46_06430 [Blastocatellia bacterium]|nr:hypothetical protein [Blastocatellia bacterium]